MLLHYRLPDALPGETVIRVVHRDLFIVLKRIVLFVILLALPVALVAMVSNLFPQVMSTSIGWPLIALSVSGYLLFIWLLFFFSIIDFILDVWIVTDQRIIDVRQSGFFSRRISEQRIARIQDVSSEMHGFFGTLLKYGNVTVQSAGQENKLFFEEVPHPEDIRDLLTRLSTQAAEKSEHSS